MRAQLSTGISRLIVGTVFTAALWGGAPSRVLAQGGASTRPIAVIVSGGASVPTGGFKDYNDLGVHADVSVLVRFAGQAIRFRPEFSYARFSVKDNPSAVLLAYAPHQAMAQRGVAPSIAARGDAALTVLPGYGAGVSDVSTLLGVLGNVEVPLAGGLYLIGGIGASSVKSGATTAAEDVSQTALTYNGGAGIRFRLGPVSGFLEGRLKNIALEKGKALFNDVLTIPVSFGLVF